MHPVPQYPHKGTAPQPGDRANARAKADQQDDSAAEAPAFRTMLDAMDPSHRCAGGQSVSDLAIVQERAVQDPLQTHGSEASIRKPAASQAELPPTPQMLAVPLFAFLDPQPNLGGGVEHDARHPALNASAQPLGQAPTPPVGQPACAPLLPDFPAPLALQTSPVMQSNPTAEPVVHRGAETPVPVVAVDSVPLAIAARAQDGIRRFEIRLDPAELGRVDIRLDVDADGSVRAHLIVERPGTLQQLQQDAPRLEQALAANGASIAQNGLSFSLKQDQNERSRQFAPQPDHTEGNLPNDPRNSGGMAQRLSVSRCLDLLA